MLRIETVINNPREFKVRRRVQRQGRSELAWCPMNKGVANFYHYHEVARAANDRYLNALAVVDRPQASVKILDRVQKPARPGQLHYPAPMKAPECVPGWFRSSPLADVSSQCHP